MIQHSTPIDLNNEFDVENQNTAVSVIVVQTNLGVNLRWRTQSKGNWIVK